MVYTLKTASNTGSRSFCGNLLAEAGRFDLLQGLIDFRTIVQGCRDKQIAHSDAGILQMGILNWDKFKVIGHKELGVIHEEIHFSFRVMDRRIVAYRAKRLDSTADWTLTIWPPLASKFFRCFQFVKYQFGLL